MDAVSVTVSAISLDPGHFRGQLRVENDRGEPKARLDREPCLFNVLDMRPQL